ncbi:MAG TPA: hypothetical protein VM802_08085 [Chitinophaga sp.]|uniref:hypothetical protein n=1 Tax=Chitinophaga sp. TaxID=1869181 RepID=UPI002B518D83|nr:hypothetical protein [Chitinophaga sp.]HVI44814.1 hypothetical protein [Chitinophaga sp.]
MNELLLQSIIDKLNKIDESIRQMISSRPTMPDYSGQLEYVSSTVDQLKTEVAKMPEQLKFPTAGIYTLSQQLEVNNDLLKRPSRREVKHYHHVNAGIIVSCGLFLLLALSCVCLFNTRAQLQNYRAGDIKYRFLQLRSERSLRSMLSATDSIYRVGQRAFRVSIRPTTSSFAVLKTLA